MKKLHFLILIIFICFIFNNTGYTDTSQNNADDIFSEDFESDPNFTSFSSTYAYWDSENIYYVQTRDNLEDKYWAHSPNFGIADTSTPISIKIDISFENQDWGTYPGVYFYESEPIGINEVTNPSIFKIYNAYHNSLVRQIGICDKKGNSYYTPQVANGSWHQVIIDTDGNGKADITVKNIGTGNTIYHVEDVDFEISDFSYMGVGYYGVADYGHNWSPIRVDNIRITGSKTIDNISDNDGSEVTEQQVAELYVATFNRAPDKPGLNFWVNDSGFTIEQIAESFFDQSETQSLYPLGTTETVFVTSVYGNLFNRAPDAAGLDYWADALGSGAVTRPVMIEAVKNGAQGTDSKIVANKAEVGLYYANKGMQEYFSLSDVTENPSTVVAIKNFINNNIALEITRFNWDGGSYGNYSSKTTFDDQNLAGYLALLLFNANKDLDELEYNLDHYMKNSNFSSYDSWLDSWFDFSNWLVADNLINIVDVKYHIATQYDEKNDQDVVIIMFQGTKDIGDILHDLTIAQTNFLDTSVQTHYGMTGILDFFINNPYKASSLTFRTNKSGRVTLEEYFNNVKNGLHQPKVILVGHSLGGALATLFGAYLVEEINFDPNHLVVYTYATPPPGQSNFNSRYSNMNVYNTRNTNDIVPYSTTIAGGYELLGTNNEFAGTANDFAFNDKKKPFLTLPELLKDIYTDFFNGIENISLLLENHGLCEAYLKDYYRPYYTSGMCDSDSVKWYKDVDMDGYSSGETLSSVEDPGDDYYQAIFLTSTSGDCNDTDPTVNPGTLEICGDGIDQDCNGGDLACGTDSGNVDNVDAEPESEFNGPEILSAQITSITQWKAVLTIRVDLKDDPNDGYITDLMIRWAEAGDPYAYVKEDILGDGSKVIEKSYDLGNLECGNNGYYFEIGVYNRGGSDNYTDTFNSVLCDPIVIDDPPLNENTTLVGTWAATEKYNPCDDRWDVDNSGETITFKDNNKVSGYYCSISRFNSTEGYWECETDAIYYEETASWEDLGSQIRITENGSTSLLDYQISENYLIVDDGNFTCTNGSKLKSRTRYKRN